MIVMLSLATAGAQSVSSIPLESVSYTVDVTGPLAEVVIRQTFRNRSEGFVDATYLFPLDDDAVVDAMVMQVGDRVIRSEIHTREEARQIWIEAANEGKVAALTEQQRANVFTQRVSNLPPGEPIEVELRVVQPVDRVDGEWELVLPLVVAPRFVRPGDEEGAVTLASYRAPAGSASDAGGAPAGSVRADIDAVIHAGLPIRSMYTPSHGDEAGVAPRFDGRDASVLVDRTPLTRDFVLRWRTDGDRPEIGLLEADGHAMLLLEAPRSMPDAQRTPRELVWVIDTSCSMEGEKLELAKRAMARALDTMDARDSFAILGFGDEVDTFSEAPVSATSANLLAGKQFVRSLSSHGGTWMERALHEALALPRDRNRRRMVVFLTDGQIGHDTELLAKIAKSTDETTFVALGIGAAPNRYLLDEMARLGGGVSAYVSEADPPEEAITTLSETMDRPVLSNFRIDWGDCAAHDLAPAAIPLLRPGHPVHVLAQIDGPCTGEVRVEALGRTHVTYHIQPEAVPHGRAMASVWARERVADLERRSMRGELEDPSEAIEEIGLSYGIVTARTSFVAVDDRVMNPGGLALPAEVPLDLPVGEPSPSGSTREFIQRIPAGRTYQTSVQSVPGVQGGSGGNPNMGGGSYNENTYMLDGANVTDPVTGTFSLNFNLDTLQPIEVSHVPEEASATGLWGREHLALDVGAEGATFGGDPLAGGLLHASVGGPLARDRAWLAARADASRSVLGPAEVLASAPSIALDLQPSDEHQMSLAGGGELGVLRLGGRTLRYGGSGAKGGWHWSDAGFGAGISGDWAHRTLGEAARTRAGFDLSADLEDGAHDGEIGVALADWSWSAPETTHRQGLVGAFARDDWKLHRTLRLSGGARVDRVTGPDGRWYASPRLGLSYSPDGHDRTRLSLSHDTSRDTGRLSPGALTDAVLPLAAISKLRAEQELFGRLRLSLEGSWSQERFAFAPISELLLVPTGPLQTAERRVASAALGLRKSLALGWEVGAGYRLAFALDPADPALLADPWAPFVPGFLDAFRRHGLEGDLAWELPRVTTRLTAAARWESGVDAPQGVDPSLWWLAPVLTVRGGVEQGFDVRSGRLSLTAAVTASSNDPSASVLPLEAYGLADGLPAIGEQPMVRADLGLRFER